MISTTAVFDRVASDTLQFFLEVADNTLATYIEVNQPATEILQEQPEYTNVTQWYRCLCESIDYLYSKEG